jgi:hypothetical protein
MRCLLIVPLCFFLVSCAEPVPETPGNAAAGQAAFIDFTKRQCTAMIGGAGVGELTRASSKLKQRARDLGADPDAYQKAENKMGVGWSFSVGLTGRIDTCNELVTKSYNIVSTV